MTASDLVRHRLHAQHLTRQRFTNAGALVAWFGALQAQDYVSARWAVGQRLRGATDRDVEQALDAGTVLRTHVLRPTWHFVASRDIRWLLALTGARVRQAAAYGLRQAGLDGRFLSRCHGTIARALGGGRALTRQELASALTRAGVATAARLGQPQVMGHILFCAEVEALVCSGPRRGRQSTYALLDERVPPSPVPPRDEAIGRLARCYFRSHGPATVEDFRWWSGLTRAEAMAAIAIAGLRRREVGGRTYWMASSSRGPNTPLTAWLLPNYDELAVAYADRRMLVPATGAARWRNADLLGFLLVVDGLVAGSWTRVHGPRAITLEVRTLGRPDRATARAIEEAVGRFARFAGLPVRRTSVK